jgi:integrase
MTPYVQVQQEEAQRPWLHDNGVSGDRPIHVLRKEFGSIINAQSDIHAASSQLRHSNIATTSAIYADNRKRSTVAVGKMLGPKAKPPKSLSNPRSGKPRNEAAIPFTR